MDILNKHEIWLLPDDCPERGHALADKDINDIWNGHGTNEWVIEQGCSAPYSHLKLTYPAQK